MWLWCLSLRYDMPITSKGCSVLATECQRDASRQCSWSFVVRHVLLHLTGKEGSGTRRLPPLGRLRTHGSIRHSIWLRFTVDVSKRLRTGIVQLRLSIQTCKRSDHRLEFSRCRIRQLRSCQFTVAAWASVSSGFPSFSAVEETINYEVKPCERVCSYNFCCIL